MGVPERGGMIIDDRLLSARANNLTLVRAVLASAVIWTHSVGQVTGKEGVDAFVPWLGVPISSIAVDGFFFLSGFLVYASLLRRHSVVAFVRARLARLWPGLAVAVLLIVAVGYTVTQAPGRAYFTGSTRAFLVGNLSLLKGAYTLTGVNCGAEPCNVNGSLWTIPWEVRCYASLALALATGLASPRWMARLLLPLTTIGAVLLHLPGVEQLIAARGGHGATFNLALIDRLWTMFALGIAAFLWRARIRLSWWIAAALLALAIVNARTLMLPHVTGVFTGYAVLCAGFLSARNGAVSGRWPDYSYGMYIYAFPVMVVASAIWHFTSPVALALTNLVLTLPLAALSWHLVEAPVLSRVRRGRPKPPPHHDVTQRQDVNSE